MSRNRDRQLSLNHPIRRLFMCRNMIRGLRMEGPLESGPAGMTIPDYFLKGRGLSLVWVSASAFLAGLAGGGTIWGLTGAITTFFLTTSTLNPTAEHFSTTRHSIMAAGASIIVSLILVTAFRAFTVEKSM